MSISEIKAFPDHGDAFISLLEKDGRKGVRAYAETLKRRKEREEKLLKETEKRREIERNLYNLGYDLLCGIDEVGRGPLAGPVMAGAVILPKEKTITGIDDSKRLSKKKREELAEKIKAEAISYAYARVEPGVIDSVNIYNATKRAMLEAVKKLEVIPEILLIDAVTLNSGIEEIPIVEGDHKCYQIGAASIIAKVKRDSIMDQYAKIYPQYGFERNKGYGTQEHIRAIEKYGLTPIHRRSFCKRFVY